MRRLLPWLAVWIAAGACCALSTRQSLEMYRLFRSGWSWDLAFYNQSYWALLYGDGLLTVRPMNSWGNDGPSVWCQTHLDPIRILFIPVYAAFSDPRTLIVIHNAILWLIVPAAFSLIRSETGSTGRALAATALVPLTPLLWPLAWSEFRNITWGMPFVLWSIQGFRQRSIGLATLGYAGMLSCREEYSILLASLVLVPPQRPEEISKTYRWSRFVVALGAGWLIFGFMGYQDAAIGPAASEMFLKSLGGPKPSLAVTLQSAWEFLAYGIGPWSLLAVLAPRFALVSVPWILGVSGGRWAIYFLCDWHWHHVRYTAPMVATVLAAGLVGFGRIGTWTVPRRGGSWIIAGVWTLSAAGLLAANVNLQGRMAQIDWPISTAEAEVIWRWIDRVGPDDGVMAAFEVTAPLSSRRRLYSNVMDSNKPTGYPTLGPEFQWVFLKSDIPPETWTSQGFEQVHRGDFLSIYHRKPAT